jgi:hypothetical protein
MPIYSNEIFNKYYLQIVNSISSWKNPDDIYAISFWLSRDLEHYIKLIVGYNTVSHYKREISALVSENSAKWNFAFWLQNVTVEISSNDIDFNNWFKSLPEYIDLESRKKTLNSKLFSIEQTNEIFIAEMIKISKELFENDIIIKALGKNIPIIIHELEYTKKSIKWTRDANPKGLSDEFEYALTQL